MFGKRRRKGRYPWTPSVNLRILVLVSAVVISRTCWATNADGFASGKPSGTELALIATTVYEAARRPQDFGDVVRSKSAGTGGSSSKCAEGPGLEGWMPLPDGAHSCHRQRGMRIFNRFLSRRPTPGLGVDKRPRQGVAGVVSGRVCYRQWAVCPEKTGRRKAHSEPTSEAGSPVPRASATAPAAPACRRARRRRAPRAFSRRAAGRGLYVWWARSDGVAAGRARTAAKRARKRRRAR